VFVVEGSEAALEREMSVRDAGLAVERTASSSGHAPTALEFAIARASSAKAVAAAPTKLVMMSSRETFITQRSGIVGGHSGTSPPDATSAALAALQQQQAAAAAAGGTGYALSGMHASPVPIPLGAAENYSSFASSRNSRNSASIAAQAALLHHHYQQQQQLLLQQQQLGGRKQRRSSLYIPGPALVEHGHEYECGGDPRQGNEEGGKMLQRRALHRSTSETASGGRQALAHARMAQDVPPDSAGRVASYHHAASMPVPLRGSSGGGGVNDYSPPEGSGSGARYLSAASTMQRADRSGTGDEGGAQAIAAASDSVTINMPAAASDGGATVPNGGTAAAKQVSATMAAAAAAAWQARPSRSSSFLRAVAQQNAAVAAAAAAAGQPVPSVERVGSFSAGDSVSTTPVKGGAMAAASAAAQAAAYGRTTSQRSQAASGGAPSGSLTGAGSSADVPQREPTSFSGELPGAGLLADPPPTATGLPSAAQMHVALSQQRKEGA
jgi:hypothetical protein